MLLSSTIAPPVLWRGRLGVCCAPLLPRVRHSEPRHQAHQLRGCATQASRSWREKSTAFLIEVLGASMRLVKEGRHEGERGRGRNEGEGSIERTVLFLLQSLPLSMIGHPNIAGVLLSVVRVASHIGTSCPHYYNIGRLVLQPLPIGTRYPRTSIPPPLPGLLLAP
jgi:hypothetical protein